MDGAIRAQLVVIDALLNTVTVGVSTIRQLAGDLDDLDALLQVKRELFPLADKAVDVALFAADLRNILRGED